jgi:hypothetical protein
MDQNYKKSIFNLNKLFSSWDQKWTPNQLNDKGQNILAEIQKNYEIPKELTYLYLGLKDDKENMRYKQFTFIDLNSINESASKMREEDQINYIDIGMSYAGMGHFWVLSWLKEERKYFIRMDGGSNGYDASHNYERYVRTKIDWTTFTTKKIKINEEERDILMEWKDLIHLLESFDILSYEMNIGNYL